MTKNQMPQIIAQSLAFLSRPCQPKPERIQLEKLDGLGRWQRLTRTHSPSQADWLMTEHPGHYRVAS